MGDGIIVGCVLVQCLMLLWGWNVGLDIGVGITGLGGISSKEMMTNTNHAIDVHFQLCMLGVSGGGGLNRLHSCQRHCVGPRET